MTQIKTREEIDNLITEWSVQLNTDREWLSIKDFAQMIGRVFDDEELEQLVREINNIKL